MKTKKRKIYIGDLLPKSKLATQKQLNYIQALIKYYDSDVKFHRKYDGKRMNIQQASIMIDCLKQNKEFEIIDKDKVNTSYKKLLQARYQAKVEERQKIAKVKQVKPKPVTWLPDKPKISQSIPKVSFEEHQAKLNQLINQDKLGRKSS
jgi:hypothetical protein